MGKAKILQFRKRNSKKQNHKGVYTGNLSVDFISNYIEDHSSFNKEYNVLLSTLRTKRSTFMFPSILCKYRRGINPVKAIYNDVQETLFYFDSSNKFHIWVLSLFNDKTWVTTLITSIIDDIKSLELFIKKYSSFYSSFITSRVQELRNIKRDFIHYLEAFLVINEEMIQTEFSI